jgi:hypothetical protein
MGHLPSRANAHGCWEFERKRENRRAVSNIHDAPLGDYRNLALSGLSHGRAGVDLTELGVMRF